MTQVREPLAPGATAAREARDALSARDEGRAQAAPRRADAVARRTRPKCPSAMGVTEARSRTCRSTIRGNPSSWATSLPRHVPPAVRGPPAPPFTSAESGRLELARWLIDPQHPLTARVMVNRVWRWHSARGWCGPPTTSAARRNVRPSRAAGLAGPPLRRLRVVDQGDASADRWLSSTYQQSSLARPRAAGGDPENRLLGRVACAAGGRGDPRRAAGRRAARSTGRSAARCSGQEPRLLLRPYVEGS